jgi:hypothetical protein
LQQAYRDRGVQALIIDVMETPAVAEGWARGHKFSFPVLLDLDGKATSPYAPPTALPDLPRDQVPIASNLIIDGEGKIRFYTPQRARVPAALVGGPAGAGEVASVPPPARGGPAFSRDADLAARAVDVAEERLDR